MRGEKMKMLTTPDGNLPSGNAPGRSRSDPVPVLRRRSSCCCCKTASSRASTSAGRSTRASVMRRVSFDVAPLEQASHTAHARHQ